MKNLVLLQSVALQVLKCLSLPEKPVNLFLREQFNSQRDAGLDQTAFDESVHRHIRNPNFFGGFFHRKSVPLQRLVFFLLNHSLKNGKTKEVLGTPERAGDSLQLTSHRRINCKQNKAKRPASTIETLK